MPTREQRAGGVDPGSVMSPAPRRDVREILNLPRDPQADRTREILNIPDPGTTRRRTGGAGGGRRSPSPEIVETVPDQFTPDPGRDATPTQREAAAEVGRQRFEASQSFAEQQQDQLRDPTTRDTRPLGVFVDRPGFQPGFVTETGLFFPTTNPGFTPSGFERGLLLPSREDDDDIIRFVRRGETFQQIFEDGPDSRPATGVVTGVPESPLFFGRVTQQLEEFGRGAGLREARGIDVPRTEVIGRGFASALAVPIGLLAFGEGVVRRPRDTIGGVISGIGGVGRRVVSGEGFPELGRGIQTGTAISIPTAGALVGTAALLGGPAPTARIVRALERSRGLPRFETEFVGTVTPTGTGATTQTLAFTSRRGLLGIRRFFTGARGTTTQIPGLESGFFTRTVGAVREMRGRDLLTGRPRFGRPQALMDIDISRMQPKQFNLLVSRQPGLDIRRPFDGFRTDSVGLTAIRDRRGFVRTRRAGASFQFGDDIFFAGTGVPMVGRIPQIAGRGDVAGRLRVIQTTDDIGGFIIRGSGQRLRTQPSSPVSAIEDAVERIVQRQAQVRERFATGVTATTPSITGVARSRFEGTGQFERTDEMAVQIPRQLTETGAITGLRTREQQIPLTGQLTRLQPREGTRLTPRLTSRQIETPLQVPGQIQLQTPRQIAGLRMAQPQLTQQITAPLVPFGVPRIGPRPRAPLIPLALGFPNLGFEASERTRVTRPRRFRRIPSLVAVAGFDVPDLGRLEETGLVARPVRRRSRTRRRSRR